MTLELNLQKGLVGHWTMDDSDTSSGVTYDKSSYGNHGTHSNNVNTSQSSILGQSYNITDPAKIESPTSSELKVVDHTLAFWIKPNNSSTSGYENLFVNGTGSTNGGRNPAIWRESNNSDSWHWRISTDNNGNNGPSNAGTIDVGEWQHFAGARNGSTLNLYKNGQNFLTYDLSDTGRGTNYNQFSVIAEDGMDADISDLRFYNRALSESEISALYNMRSQRSYNI